MISLSEYAKQLEPKAEELIIQARNAGADANYQYARSRMLAGKVTGNPTSYLLAMSHLDESIASAIREGERRATRRPWIVRFKNLIGL